MLAIFALACGAASDPPSSTASPDVPGPWAEHPVPRVQVPLDDTPGRGAEHPLVTVVVFTDFECPFCLVMAPVLERLLEEHGDEVRLHHRHMPLPIHEHAIGLAMAVEEAREQGGDEAFWAMHDRIFENPGATSDAALAEHARALGLDVDRFRDAIRFQSHFDRVEDDLTLADRVGARGTPTLYLNGRPVFGALRYGELEAIFAEERGLAQEAIGRGIPRDQIYAAAMRGSRREAPPRELSRPRERRRLDRRVLYAIPVDGAPMRGPREAPVTIVMFSDFECPHCGDVLPTLNALGARYPDQLRFLFRHNPLPSHSRALPAAIAASEAYAQRGDEGFWQMHDLLMSNPRGLADEHLIAYAEQVGLDAGRFRAALGGRAHRDAVEADQALAARFGATGTPTFFVNGRVIPGAVDLDFFIDAIDEARERADEELARGTSPAELYAALIADAAGEAVYRGGRRDRERVPIRVPDHAPRLGAREPAIIIQVFSEFECPFCAEAQPTLARILEEHPDVQLAFRHYPLPFHGRARPAATAAIEVREQLGDEAFWAFADLLFEDRSRLAPGGLLATAREVGADPDRVARAIEERAHDAVIDADVAAVRAMDWRIGTPAFLVGDRPILGAQPYSVFEAAIRSASGN